LINLLNMYAKEYFNYQLKRNWFQKWVRKFYLKNIAKKCQGKIIDLGCGIGDLIKMLKNNSLGLETNKFAVKYCQDIGLNVINNEDFGFEFVNDNEYKTVVMSHVLEHLDNPKTVVANLFKKAILKGIRRIIFVVPGKIGYFSDKTHRNFISTSFFEEINDKNFMLQNMSYFPVNMKFFGNYFTHNETIAVYDKRK